MLAPKQVVDLVERNGAELTIVEMMDRPPVVTTRQTAAITRQVTRRILKNEFARLVGGSLKKSKAKSDILEGGEILEITRKALAAICDLAVNPVSSAVGSPAQQNGQAFAQKVSLSSVADCASVAQAEKCIVAAVDNDGVEIDAMSRNLIGSAWSRQYHSGVFRTVGFACVLSVNATGKDPVSLSTEP